MRLEAANGMHEVAKRAGVDPWRDRSLKRGLHRERHPKCLGLFSEKAVFADNYVVFHLLGETRKEVSNMNLGASPLTTRDDQKHSQRRSCAAVGR